MQKVSEDNMLFVKSESLDDSKQEDLLISKVKEITFKMILIDWRSGLKITE